MKSGWRGNERKGKCTLCRRSGERQTREAILGSFKVALIGTLITFLIMSIMSIFAQNFL